MTPSITFWVILCLWCNSDRAYDPGDYKVPIIFQDHKAGLLVYVPPGRQRIVAIDLKTMSILGSYEVVKDVQFPKTRGGEPAKIMRFYVLIPGRVDGLLNEKGKKMNGKDSIGVIFNTRETGALDLCSGFYQLLSTSGDW